MQQRNKNLSFELIVLHLTQINDYFESLILHKKKYTNSEHETRQNKKKCISNRVFHWNCC